VGKNPQELVLFKPGEKDPSRKAPLTLETRSLAVSQDGKTIALSYNETGELSPKKMFGRTELWDVAAWKLRSTLPAEDPKEFLAYDQLVLSADGKYLAGLVWHSSEAKESQIDIWDVSGKKLNTLKVQEVIFVPGDLRWTFTPDGKSLIIAFCNLFGNKKTLKIFENVQVAAKVP
jgi:WD40 repeat protein